MKRIKYHILFNNVVCRRWCTEYVKNLKDLIFFMSDCSDCSLYNPCGQNGYCKDNDYGEWTCECKFWWNGTRCEFREFKEYIRCVIEIDFCFYSRNN
jgi:hypothetical protein